MRPERLTITGLRSYRDEVEVDFTPLGLTALIGDTGAGKSSIIEALSVALYNRPTWKGTGVQSLRADNAKAMQVNLTFSVRTGTTVEQWTVTRMHREGAAASVHKLDCVTTGEKVDGERAINARIERLIGLTHEQFTKAVAIPQGQFARLLEATGAERTKMLKSIFRLDHLSEVKEHADALHRRYGTLIAERRGLRSGLPADPTAALELAEAAVVAAEGEVKRLVDAVNEADAHEAAAKEASEAVAMATRAITRIRGRLDPSHLDELDAAALVLGEIDAGAARVEADRLEAAAALDRAEQLVARALQPFAARDDALRARMSLAAAHQQAQEAARRAESVRARRSAVEDAAATEAIALARAAAATAGARAEGLAAAEAASGAAVRELGEAAAAIAKAAKAAMAERERFERSLLEARTALDEALEANALAAVAGHCQPGDGCPVCDRPLPPTFSAPTDAGIEAARAQVADVEQALASARDAAHAAAQARDDADDALGRARRELELAAAAAAEARQLATKTVHEADQLEAERDRELAAIATDEADLAAGLAAIVADAKCLPATLAVDPFDDAAVAGALERIDTALRASDDAAQAVAAARAELDALGVAAAALAARRDHEVRPRIAAAREATVALAAELSDTPAPPPVDAPLPEQRAWVASVMELAAQAIDDATQRSEAARVRAEASAEAVAAVCASAGAATFDDLRACLLAAQQAVAVATKESEAAASALEKAARLDAVLALGEPFVANLDALRQTLTDGKFIRALVAEREHDLLVEASRKLRELTSDGFGFADSFKVVDRRTGQTRTPETLSGGERFLASLALALGLVEIATRGGGQLDALFLDEGFGSLDAASLDQALATLGTLAVGGKLVALVSHLRRVAEHVDQVLLVERDDVLGSRVRLLTPDERDELLTEDARSGLTL